MDVAALIERYLPGARFTSMDDQITSWDSTCGVDQPSLNDLKDLQKHWDNDEGERVRESKLVELKKASKRALESVVSPYSDLERETWGKQESQARAYLADNEVETVFLDNCAATAGISKEDLVDRIMAKVNAYEIATGIIQGQTTKIRDQIKDSKLTVKKLKAFKISYK